MNNNKSGILYIILSILVSLSIIFFGYRYSNFITVKNNSSDKDLLNKYTYPNSYPNNNPSETGLDKTKAITPQEVNNLGYTFSLGQVDYPDAPAISDDIKNQITKIVFDAHFPKSLLKDLPIIFLNSLAVISEQYIVTPKGNAKLITLTPYFLSEGGIYSTYSNGINIIYINKTILNNGTLTDTLTHELGHAIGATLTDQDWNTFYQLRNIPTGTERYGTNWNLSPAEDFAEVYKSIFTGKKPITNYGTVYSNEADIIKNNCDQQPVPSFFDDIEPGYSARIKKECENAIKTNASMFGIINEKIIDQNTKDFVTQIIDKLNN
jgi:hypothetical protein